MKVAIHTLGTRGDVQPYLALAMGLRAAGHEVLLAAPAQFESFVRGRGVPFAPLPGAMLELLDDPEVRAVLGGSRSLGALLRMKRRVQRLVAPMMRALLDAEWDVASAFRPQVLVHHPKALAAPHIATHLGAAAILASPLPGFTPTAAFPSALVPWRSLGPFNGLTHTMTARASDWVYGKLLRRWRSEVLGEDGARLRRPRAGTLYAYSPIVIPVPPEWGQDVCVSGYWFLDEPAGWQASPQLAQFLDQGPPPVYIGFGSMPIAEPQAFTRMVVQAVQRAGCRAVLAAGWGGLGAGELPPQVHLLDAAPHDRLFPLMAAVVHHGGAGSTAAGLRAGRPTVICPFLGDQAFWGHRVAALGAGPAPMAARSLSADALGAALARALHEPGWRENAQRIAASIAREDGVAKAVEFIEHRALAPLH